MFSQWKRPVASTPWTFFFLDVAQWKLDVHAVDQLRSFSVPPPPAPSAALFSSSWIPSFLDHRLRKFNARAHQAGVDEQERAAEASPPDPSPP